MAGGRAAKYNTSGLSILQLGGLLAIGILTALNAWIVTAIWFIVILFTVYAGFTNKSIWIWYGIAASPFLELSARLNNAPIIPSEIGKYYLVVSIAMLYFISLANEKKPRALYNTGTGILAFLLPSLLVAIRVFSLDQWVFNVLSLIELALLLNLASRERWDVERFCKTLQVGALPIIPILVFLIFSTPNLSEVEYNLNANTTTTAGFGSNQVSTIIGLGIAFMMGLLVLRRPFISIVWLNYVLIGLLLFRGLLTFSRGGIIGGMMTAIIMLLPAMFSSARSFLRYSLLGIVVLILSYAIFEKANSLTDNKLLLRYQGETAGTASGDKKKSFNTATSGRADLINADINIFISEPLFGVGPGEAKNLRVKYGAATAAAHTEYTRLLSEHGIGGGIIAIILIGFPFVWVRKQKLHTWRGISAGLFFLAVFSAAHSASRTNITVVAYVLAAMPIYYFNVRKTQSAT